MDEEGMLEWVELVWKPYAKTIDGVKLLFIDDFSAHKTGAVRKAIADCDTELEIIPGGYTGKLQVMDVGGNKPFKDRIRKKGTDFMDENEVGKRPQRKDVSYWVSECWNALPDDMLQRTWIKIGYKMPGLEHHNGKHPTLQEEDDNNNHHDPLALVKPTMNAARDNDKYDSNGSLEY